jgi:DNA replication protein DnaC
MLRLSIRDTYKPESERSELDILGPVTAVPTLFLEDVGVTVSLGRAESDFSLRIFETLLDQRLEHGRATFLTSNKSPEELDRSFDPRVLSRLCQACEILDLTGPDRRRPDSLGPG